MIEIAHEVLRSDAIAALAVAYSYAYGVVNGFILRLFSPVGACVAYLALELVLPIGQRNSTRSYLRGARFLLTQIAVVTVVFSVVTPLIDYGQLKAYVILDLTPLTESSFLPVRMLGWLVAGFAIGMLSNFLYYWWHRAQHTIPVLWRFHKVHHSIGELSAFGSYHHVSEDLFQYFLILVPTALLIGVNSGYVPAIVVAVIATHSYYIHSSANINIGPLRYIIGDNRFHRLHHSTEPRHFDKNFGTTTPLWDVLFGTAYFPARGEWPQVGLADVPEPDRIRDYLLMPFRPQKTLQHTEYNK